MSVLLSIRDLRHLRTGYAQSKFLLDIPRLSISRGGVLAVVGGSGSGKTTLLNLVSGLEPVQEGGGEIEFDIGGESGILRHESSVLFPMSKVGRVFQQGHLLPTATVAANLAVARHAAGKPYDRVLLGDALERAGLDAAFLDRRAWQLSGGEAQRVSIARAMVSEPEVIFADEPTSNADPDLADYLVALFRSWVDDPFREQERTLVWITHDCRLAAHYADEVLVLRGENAEAGTVASVIDDEELPRSNPGREEVLHDWIGRVERPLPENHSVPLPEPNAARRAGRGLAGRLSMGELFSRRSAAALFPVILDRTSVGATGDGRSLNDWWQMFQPRSLFLRHILASLLMLVAIGGLVLQLANVSKRVNDTGFCNVVVSGIIRSSNALEPEIISGLGTRPWLKGPKEPIPKNRESSFELFNALDSEETSSGCAPMNGAWPRLKYDIRVALPDASGDCKAYHGTGDQALIRLDVMAVHSREPFLRSLRLSRNHAERISTSSPSEPWGRGMSVIVSRAFATFGLKATPEEIDGVESICVSVNSNDAMPEPFAGVAESLPADREFVYEGLVPLEVFEDEIGGIKEYSTAALYFRPREINKISEWLLPPDDPALADFKFDPDALKKFSSSIRLNIATLSGTAAIVVLIVFVNGANLTATYAGVIEQNARAIAMQLSIGAPRPFVRRFLLNHMAVVWAMSTAIVLLIGLVGSALVLAAGFLPMERTPLLGLVLAITPLGTFIVSWFAILRSAGAWERLNKGKYADILQGGN